MIALAPEPDGAAAPATAPLPSATELAGALRRGALGAEEVVRSHLARIAALDPHFKAFITVDEAGALRAARALDRLPAEARGPLHGLPVAVKDLTDTAGLRTTYGSRLFADHVPEADDLVVARLRQAGAVVIGKANTPEFGFGAVCTNPLCGPTCNPFDASLTSGGSSGGSAVAVATGMAALAHGTDFGGSVRTPASFCGTLALRPTPGAIPSRTRALGWDGTATHGILARTVDDCALMFGAVAGPDGGDPLSALIPSPPSGRLARLAATPDFGIAPVSREARARFAEAVEAVAEILGPVRAASPDCREAPVVFRRLRAAHVQHAYGPLARRFGDRLTPTVRWNIAAGEGLSAVDYLAAEATRTELFRRFVAFFQDCDVLLAPAASVLPWPNADGEVLAMDGVPLADVLDYLTVTFVVSLVGFPVLTLPAPMGAHRLPFGLQLIGRPGSEPDLLALGRRLEAGGFRAAA